MDGRQSWDWLAGWHGRGAGSGLQRQTDLVLDTDGIDSFDCVNKRAKTRSRGEGKGRREDKREGGRIRWEDKMGGRKITIGRGVERSSNRVSE